MVRIMGILNYDFIIIYLTHQNIELTSDYEYVNSYFVRLIITVQVYRKLLGALDAKFLYLFWIS